MQLSNVSAWWAGVSAVELMWLAVGFTAQAMFMMRFVIQWIASERVRRSIVPEAFWYFSLAGGLMLFVYAVYRHDPVFILGQGTGLLIYSRNIYFIWQSTRQGTATVPVITETVVRVAGSREVPPEMLRPKQPAAPAPVTVAAE